MRTQSRTLWLITALTLGTGCGGATEGNVLDPGPDAPGASAPFALSASPSLAPVVGPSGDAFYVPPSDIGAYKPGDVIWYRSSVFTTDLLLKRPEAVNAWQVLYRSTSATGAPMAVSGIVLVPRGWFLGTRPIVGWAPGTQGMGDGCAVASKGMTQGTYYEGGSIKEALAMGWAVAVTDYQGLGTPEDHTYVVGRAEGDALLDVVRAAQRTPGAGLSASAMVGFYGYSQGGGAAAWAAQLQPTYAPELDVRGVAAGGVPSDLTAVKSVNDGGLFVGLVLYAALGLNAAYPELRLDSFLNAKGRATLPAMRDGCDFFSRAYTHVSDYVTTDPLTTPAWQARMAEQALGGSEPRAPIFLYHSVFDEVVPYAQAASLRNRWCTKGVKVYWADFWFSGHVIGLLQGWPAARDYLRNRFLGFPTPTSCP